MDNRRAIIISLICFAISIILITGYVTVRKYEMTKEFGDEVSVIVAAKDIPEFGVIRSDMLKRITVFKAFRQPQTVTTEEELIGKSTLVSIYKDEQIPLSKIVDHRGKPQLDRQIVKNYRAITVGITEKNAVSKLIRPGNYVDVLGIINFNLPDGELVFEVKTILQNVLVLATGKTIMNYVPTRVSREVLEMVENELSIRRRKDALGDRSNLVSERPTSNYTTLTLHLSTEDAEKILYMISRFGEQRLFFTLRNSADRDIAQVNTTLLDEVLGPNSDYGLSKRKLPPPPPAAGPKFYDSRGGVSVPVQ